MQYRGHTLDETLLRLWPDVFFHPVWTYFGRTDNAAAIDILHSLRQAAEDLQAQGEVSAASQLWLACAARQFWQNDDEAALISIGQALTLAKQHALSMVTCWATWGASAVCVHQADFQRAAEYLEQLRIDLTRWNEWILADVVELVQQTVLSRDSDSVTSHAESAVASPFDSTLTPAIDLLLRWGEPLSLPATWPNRRHPTDASALARFNRRWRQLWQTVKRISRGELRLQWVAVSDRRRSQPLDQLDWPVFPLETIKVTPTTDRPVSILPSADAATRPIEPQAFPPKMLTESAKSTPTLTIYTLGAFQLAVNDIPTNHSISGKNRTVFEYLLIHHNQPVLRDVLMDVFWPNAEPDSARNRLNVALHHVRQALRQITEIPVVLFEEGAYHLNPEFDLWIDAEEFDQHVRKGRQLEMVDRGQAATKEYELARDLYQGDFMSEEPYEDWMVLTRERLRADYLDILDRLGQIYFDQGKYLDCVRLCQSILARDSCREDAHCRLMQCYSRQNQRFLALRQYQTCVKALRTELDVEPASATTQLYERIRRRERV